MIAGFIKYCILLMNVYMIMPCPLHTNLALFSCIFVAEIPLFKLCMYFLLLYIHFEGNFFLQHCLYYVLFIINIANIDVVQGQLGASRFFWGPITGPVAVGA